MNAPAFNYAFANPLPEPNWEGMADDILLQLSKLRERLVVRDFNTAACRVDEAIDAMQAACREFVK